MSRKQRGTDVPGHTYQSESLHFGDSTNHQGTIQMSMLSRIIIAAAAAALLTGGSERAAAQGSSAVDWSKVEAAIGRSGAAQPGDVYRFNFPRTDLKVMVGDLQVKPSLALGGWVAFKPAPGGAIAAGDLVLLESELNPVITALQAGGVEQTAIHHHIINESPRVLYMHVHGHGDPVAIARAVKSAVAVTAIPAPAAPGPQPALDLDTAKVARTLGYSGRANGGVYAVSVARAETIREMGVDIPPSLGLGTAINFQPTGNGRAAITGDFVMLGSEVNPVIRALRENGIQVTSLHSHMLMEEPRLFFMHFWANDDAEKLAKGLRAALEKTNSAKPNR
jgi:hypothetical protein